MDAGDAKVVQVRKYRFFVPLAIISCVLVVVSLIYLLLDTAVGIGGVNTTAEGADGKFVYMMVLIGTSALGALFNVYDLLANRKGWVSYFKIFAGLAALAGVALLCGSLWRWTGGFEHEGIALLVSGLLLLAIPLVGYILMADNLRKDRGQGAKTVINPRVSQGAKTTKA